MSIGIVGLGYVGLPLAVGFAEAGEQVIGVDVDHGRVAELTAGRSPIEDIPDERLQAVAAIAAASRTRSVELHEAEAILVCVPTPLTRNREPDLGPLLSAAQALAGVVRRDQLIVLESTTFPGTTREHMVPLLEESGLRAGEDFALAFSPERVDPGRTDYTMRTTPKVVGGLTPALHRARRRRLRARLRRGRARSRRPRSPSSRSCWRTSSARSTSRSSTSWRSSPTGWASTSGRSSTPRRPSRTASRASSPGPGMGGHCLPVDPFYLAWKAREYDLSTEFIELAGKVNQYMPYFCMEKIERALNDAHKPVRGSRVLLLGVSYKAGVGDIRESPALKIIQLLRERGADVRYHDPHVPELAEHDLRSAALDEALEGIDLAVIVTAHPSVDHGRVVERAPQVLDLRGTTRHLGAPQL